MNGGCFTGIKLGLLEHIVIIEHPPQYDLILGVVIQCYELEG